MKTGTNDQNSVELSFVVFFYSTCLGWSFIFHFVIKFKPKTGISKGNQQVAYTHEKMADLVQYKNTCSVI